MHFLCGPCDVAGQERKGAVYSFQPIKHARRLAVRSSVQCYRDDAPPENAYGGRVKTKENTISRKFMFTGNEFIDFMFGHPEDQEQRQSKGRAVERR